MNGCLQILLARASTAQDQAVRSATYMYIQYYGRCNSNNSRILSTCSCQRTHRQRGVRIPAFESVCCRRHMMMSVLPCVPARSIGISASSSASSSSLVVPNFACAVRRSARRPGWCLHVEELRASPHCRRSHRLRKVTTRTDKCSGVVLPVCTGCSTTSSSPGHMRDKSGASRPGCAAPDRCQADLPGPLQNLLERAARSAQSSLDKAESGVDPGRQTYM